MLPTAWLSDGPFPGSVTASFLTSSLLEVGVCFLVASCAYRSGIRDTRSLQECCKELLMRWVNFRSVFSGPRWRSKRRPLRIGRTWQPSG